MSLSSLSSLEQCMFFLFFLQGGKAENFMAEKQLNPSVLNRVSVSFTARPFFLPQFIENEPQEIPPPALFITIPALQLFKSPCTKLEKGSFGNNVTGNFIKASWEEM